MLDCSCQVVPTALDGAIFNSADENSQVKSVFVLTDACVRADD